MRIRPVLCKGINENIRLQRRNDWLQGARPSRRNFARRAGTRSARDHSTSGAIPLAMAIAVRRIAERVIAVRAACHFIDDPVDRAGPQQIGSPDPHRFGGVGRVLGAALQHRRASQRRNHLIDRMFEHQHAVGSGNRDRAARSALADDDRDRDRDRRGAERQVALGRSLNRLGLVALFGAEARKSRGVSTRVITGSPKRLARFISRMALR